MVRLAVDIGGTFTDVALEDGSHVHTAKVLTTPAEPELALLDGVSLALERANRKSHDVSVIIHGTTLATNAILQRQGARTALVTTEGFRDVIEVGYENRYEQYDLQIDLVQPLVPRFLRFTVPERMRLDGVVLKALDESAMDDIASSLAEHNIEAVAVGFLHAYANPAHEQRVRELLLRRLPTLHISLSSEVCPEVREYERITTTTANAYVMPLMASYIQRLTTKLKQGGYQCPLLLMTSAGTLTSPEIAAKYPVRLVESGPAGGAILASEIAREMRLKRVLSLDMGGTTAKVCVVSDGSPSRAREFEVGVWPV
jgi:N-methylhydantoinase A